MTFFFFKIFITNVYNKIPNCLSLVVVYVIEEELKRLHAAGYGQVGFNYDLPAQAPAVTAPVEADEPFVPTPSYKALFAPDILLVSLVLNILQDRKFVFVM